MELHLPVERNVDAWQVYVWNLPDDFVSRAQKLQLMQMLEGGFNQFDPFRVVGDLLRHRDLWRGVVMDRAHTQPPPVEGEPPDLVTNLIKLRDIHQCWNVDSLFILTEPAKDAEWARVTEDWLADEI